MKAVGFTVENAQQIQQDSVPLDSVVLPETHSPMYLIHKYWARKPANVVAEYIKKYSKQGDLVLDPFFGSGVVLFESLLLNRNSVGMDLNPFCSFLVNTMLMPYSESDLTNATHILKNKLMTLLQEMYEIECPNCHSKAEITHVIYCDTTVKNNSKKNQSKTLNEYADSKKESITDIYWYCPICGNQKTTDGTIINKEYERINRIENEFQQYREKYSPKYPEFKFRYKNGNNFIQLRHDLIINPDISLLFTKRALLVLGTLYKEICSLDCHQYIKDHLKLIFSSSLSQTSKMVWVIKTRKNKAVKNKEAGSWTHHFFWNPTEYFEINVWNCFQTRLKKLISGKNDFEDRIRKRLGYADINSFYSDLLINPPNFSRLSMNSKHIISIFNQSSTNMPLDSESVDFIFTDPPYGDSIQYMELSTLWNLWLELTTLEQLLNKATKEEITINNRQGKDLEQYKKMLTDVFSECFRVLKDHHFMVVTFHNTEQKIRNALIEAATDAGFTLEQITYQMPPRVSVKSMLHHSGTPIGDLFIRFRKIRTNVSNKSPEKKIEIKSISSAKKLIEEIIATILRERAEPTNWVWISTFLDQELFKRGMYPVENVEKIIQELSKGQRFKVKDGYEWWFAAPENEQITAKQLSKRIEEEILKILHKHPNLRKQKKEQTEKQFIYNELYKIFAGILTPDKLVVSKILEKHLKLPKGG